MKKPEQPILNNPENLPNYEKKANQKIYVWLKSQSSEKPHEENSKIENLKGDIVASYPPEEKPFSKNKLKVNTPEANRPPAIYPKEKKSILKSILDFLGRNKKKIALTGIATGISIASMASSKSTEGDPTDSLRNSDMKKMEAVINKTSEKIEIKIANYFQTDKAEISKENAEEISKLINEYVNSLNMDNVDQFINSTPSLNVSCDPRPTNSYKNGNEGLALARANETQKVISSLNISNGKLTPEKLEQVREKLNHLKFNIPPGGVVDYHMVATDAELEEAKTNKAKKDEINQRMRFVNLELFAVNKEKPKIIIETDGGFFNIEKYSEAFLIIDQSSSMKDSKTLEKIIKQLSGKKQKDIPTHVIGYTNKVNTEFMVNNLITGLDTAKDIKYNDETRERTIDVLISVLKQQERKEERRIAYTISDEMLQNLSETNMKEITQLSKDKNIEIRFTLNLDGEEFDLTLKEISDIFNKKHGQEEIIKRKGFIKDRIKQLEKALMDTKENLNIANSSGDKSKGMKKSIKEFEQGIKEIEELISINQENLKKHDQIDLDYNDFVNAKKKDLKQIGKDYANTPNTVAYPGSDITKNK